MSFSVSLVLSDFSTKQMAICKAYNASDTSSSQRKISLTNLVVSFFIYFTYVHIISIPQTFNYFHKICGLNESSEKKTRIQTPTVLLFRITSSNGFLFLSLSLKSYDWSRISWRIRSNALNYNHRWVFHISHCQGLAFRCLNESQKVRGKNVFFTMI